MGYKGRPNKQILQVEKMDTDKRRRTFTNMVKDSVIEAEASISEHTASGKPCQTFFNNKELKPKKTKFKKNTKRGFTKERFSKFRRQVTWPVEKCTAEVEDIPSLIDSLTEAWKIITTFHRKIQRSKKESDQEKYIPDTFEISLLWKSFLELQDKCKKRKIPCLVEFAPFVVYGRTKEDRMKKWEDRWTIGEEFDNLPLKSVKSFVNWGISRKKRVVALYLNLKRSHIMAMMLKPDGACSEMDNHTFVGLHKFDANASHKSNTDNEMKRDHFPEEVSFYRNTTRIQSLSDYTCTFWCLHWTLWKMITSARLSLAIQQQKAQGEQRNVEDILAGVPTVLDSFRSPAYKKWAKHIRDYICTPEALGKPPTIFGLLMLTDRAWLDCP